MNADLTVHTWRTSEYRYLVTAPDPEVYEEIRRLVPADRLDYDPLRKVWRIRGVYWLSLKRALEDLGYGRVREHQSRASYEQSNPDTAGATLAAHSHEAFRDAVPVARRARLRRGGGLPRTGTDLPSPTWAATPSA